jgi:hypothetical protein
MNHYGLKSPVTLAQKDQNGSSFSFLRNYLLSGCLFQPIKKPIPRAAILTHQSLKKFSCHYYLSDLYLMERTADYFRTIHNPRKNPGLEGGAGGQKWSKVQYLTSRLT